MNKHVLSERRGSVFGCNLVVLVVFLSFTEIWLGSTHRGVALSDKARFDQLLQVEKRRFDDNEFEIVTFSPVIILKGEINGNPARVLFDTGTWPNVVDDDFESKLVGKVEMLSEDQGGWKVCDYRNLTVNNYLSTSAGRICLIDLDPLLDGAELDIDAIAGIPFIYDRVFEIDFENQTFKLKEFHSAQYDVVVELEFDKHCRPWVRISSGEFDECFLIDTGYNGFFDINEKTAERISEIGIAKESGDGFSFGHSDEFKMFRNKKLTIKQLEIFGHQFNQIPVVVSSEKNSKNKIGLELLKRFHVCIDLKCAKLRLKKNQDFAESNGCFVSENPLESVSENVLPNGADRKQK